MELLFREIILAYDGSEGSGKALKLAATLTKDHMDSHLTVVNVYDEKIENRRVDIAGDSHAGLQGYLLEGIPTPPVSLGYAQTQISTQAIITNSVEQIFFDAKKELQETNVCYQILKGPPAESICSYAEDINADLIIVGSSGKNGIKSLLLGNITKKISQMATCHVLIAK